jgi:hypothetical protein
MLGGLKYAVGVGLRVCGQDPALRMLRRLASMALSLPISRLRLIA